MDWQFEVENVVLQDGEFQSSAFFTFETLSSTSKGRMSPVTTTILVSKSTLYEVTPVFEKRQKEIRSVLGETHYFIVIHKQKHTRFY
jgi:hypothetical protein